MPQEVEFIPTLKEAGHKKSRSVLIPGKTSGGIFVFPCFAQFLPHQQGLQVTEVIKASTTPSWKGWHLQVVKAEAEAG